jgi:hypothetical protein
VKSLFVTLLIFGAAFAAYDFFAAPAGEKILFKHLNKGVAVPSPTTAPANTPSVATTEPAPAMTEPTAPATTAPVAPAAPSTPTPSTTAAPEPQVEASGFRPPQHPSMDELTKNWTMIPPTAFPRPIKLLKDTLFKMSVGGSTIAAGAQAVALGFENSMLTVAPTATSAARAQLPMDDTDLKKSILDGYEIYKVKRTEALRRLYERKLVEAKANASAPMPSGPGSGVTAEGKPEQNIDGSYPLLVAHLKGADLAELKADKISSWSDAQPTNHEGKPAWAIKVNAEVNSIFGPQPVDILCIVKNGRVEGWYYAGSGEPVP